MHTHLEEWAANTAVPGEQLGVRCLAQGSHLSRGQFLPKPRFEPTTSGYKSDALSIWPWLPRNSGQSWQLKTSFCWAPELTHLRMCWFSRTSHTDNQMSQHPHFQSGFLLCSIKWLTTYGFAIYSCIYLFMHVCVHLFVLQLLLTSCHFLLPAKLPV